MRRKAVEAREGFMDDEKCGQLLGLMDVRIQQEKANLEEITKTDKDSHHHHHQCTLSGGLTAKNSVKLLATTFPSRAGRHDVDVDADYANYGLFERLTLTLTPITPITAFFSAVMTDDVDAVTGISKKFRVTDDGDLGAGDMNTLYRFWSLFFAGQFQQVPCTVSFANLLLEDAGHGLRYGIESLFRFYSYGLEKKMRPKLYNDFQETTLQDIKRGHTFDCKYSTPLEVKQQIAKELAKYRANELYATEVSQSPATLSNFLELFGICQIENSDANAIAIESLHNPCTLSGGLTAKNSVKLLATTFPSRAGRHDVDVDADYANYGLFERLTLTLTPITPITAFFSAVMTDDVDAVTGISKKFRVTDDGDLGAGDMNTLYRFWSLFFAGQFQQVPCTVSFANLLLEDAGHGLRYGIESLFRFYSYGLEKKMRPKLYNDFQETTLQDIKRGHTFDCKYSTPLEVKQQIAKELAKYRANELYATENESKVGNGRNAMVGAAGK
ncbi:hypothetical protein GPALN_014822 [Globodera pallida]|nr:hypothetical protein GPALN_014822 [Globodera pallida]